MGSVPEFQRPFLTILVWALILEIIAIAYYISQGQAPGLELGLLAFVTSLTILGIALIIRKIRAEL